VITRAVIELRKFLRDEFEISSPSPITQSKNYKLSENHKKNIQPTITKSELILIYFILKLITGIWKICVL
jgi:hypothetical protein